MAGDASNQSDTAPWVTEAVNPDTVEQLKCSIVAGAEFVCTVAKTRTP